MSTISSFKNIENKYGIYRGKPCMKKFCESLRKHLMKIINFKKMNLLTKEWQESYENRNNLKSLIYKFLDLS